MDKSFTKALRGWKYSYEELKAECAKLGIKNSVEYKERYQLYDGFPAHPERTYDSDWISYNDFLGIPQFVSYGKLKNIVQNANIRSLQEYKKHVTDLEDPSLPLDPQTVYLDEWENWYRFVGKEEPYRIEYMDLVN